MDIKLRYSTPPILSFLHHAYPLGIFWDESNDSVKSWFCNNYNYVFSTTQGRFFFNFLVNYKDTPFLTIKNILEHELKKLLLITELPSLIFENLSLGYYVEILTDQYYISNSKTYQKEHYVHELFINGIDKVKEVYNAWAYKNGVYQELEIPFKEVVPFYNSSYYDGSDIIIKLYHRKEGDFTFLKEVFLFQIYNYINSINPYKYIAPFGDYERYKTRVFGLYAIQSLFDKFEVTKGEGIDIRFLRVIYEHFTSMKMKINYFNELDVTFTQQEEMFKFYNIAVPEAKLVLMMGAKYNINKDYVENNEYYYKIMKKLNNLIDEELTILISFIGSNSV